MSKLSMLYWYREERRSERWLPFSFDKRPVSSFSDIHLPGLFLFVEARMTDIDQEHDLSHMTRAQYLEEIRHIQQLATCPCTECESRCWSTDEITDCELYRRWWDKQNGIRRDYL